MSYILITLTTISLIITLVGLIKPQLILKGKNKRSRKKVMKIYGSLLLILLIFLSINFYIAKSNDTVDHYIREARREIKENDNYEMAVRNYKKAIKKWDKNGEYVVNKVEFTREYEKALEVLKDRVDGEAFGEIGAPWLYNHPEF